MKHLIVVILLLIATPAFSETIFYGEPEVREVSTGEGAPEIIRLSNSEATEYSVSIVEKHGSYYWASRAWLHSPLQ